MSLTIDRLTKEYPTRSGTLSVLRGVTLTLQRGDAVAAMGPSGSGKSTHLHIPGTLDRPSRERQRVAIARALIHRPPLLLADEPTGNLDRNTAKAIGEMLLELHRQENTILVAVTHSAELAATFPRRMVMNDGLLEPA